MNVGRYAGLVLGLVMPLLPASAQEADSTQGIMNRAQLEAQRRSVEDLVQRLEGTAKRQPSRADAAPHAADAPEIRTRSLRPQPGRQRDGQK